jgi:hypothetical protein
MRLLKRRDVRDAPLPPLDLDAVCAKCGHDDVMVLHHPGEDCSEGENCGSCEAEYMYRRCLRCSFVWFETVLS